jgi:hypothetical protein
MFASVWIRLAAGDAALEEAVDTVRAIHRVAALTASVLIVLVAVFGWDKLQRPIVSRAAIVALLGLALALAILGRYTPSHSLFVTLGNPLGGLAMVGLAWWLCLMAASLHGGRLGYGATGWILAAIAFAAVTAIVLWPPSGLIVFSVHLAATGLLVGAVTLLHRDVAK